MTIWVFECGRWMCVGSIERCSAVTCVSLYVFSPSRENNSVLVLHEHMQNKFRHVRWKCEQIPFNGSACVRSILPSASWVSSIHSIYQALSLVTKYKRQCLFVMQVNLMSASNRIGIRSPIFWSIYGVIANSDLNTNYEHRRAICLVIIVQNIVGNMFKLKLCLWILCLLFNLFPVWVPEKLMANLKI